MSNIIQQVREQASQGLETRLNKMLDTADDRLFDMADKSNEVIFFHSMRMIRIKRKGLINSFRQEISSAFQSNLTDQSVESPTGDNVESFSLDNIALVKDDDLEEDLAIEGMIAKARAANVDALRHLETRLDTLCVTVSVNENSNPIDPKAICEAFRISVQVLDLDIESLLIIFKLFERCVIEQLDEVYSDINELLAEKGVLPDLHKRRPKPKKQASRSENNANADEQSFDDPDFVQPQEQGNGQDGVRDEVFYMLRDLLSSQKSPALARGRPSVDTSQLVGALNSLQQQAHIAGDFTAPQEIRQAIGGLLPTVQGTVHAGVVGNVNDDVIDIVTMLFDFILEDRNLHNDIKAILARLQIPMLKIGLVDREFFSRRNHPARRLLNLLAQAGIGWQPGASANSDILLAKVTNAVERVVTEFQDDMGLFEELCQEFESFQRTDSRRSGILEKRVRETEEGKARAESARKAVNEEIKRVCHRRVIAAPVKAILKEAWTNVLFIESLKRDSHDGWDKAVKVAEFLVWSVQPKKTEDARNKLRKIMPSLIKNLKLGMDKISFSTFRASQLLSELEECHRKVLEISKQRLSSQAIESPANSEQKQLAAQEHKAVAQEIGETATEQTLEELTLASQQPTVGVAQERESWLDVGEEVNESDPVYQQVDQIQAGAWVEICREGDERQRCKLAAYIASSQKYIFVNRAGVKITEVSREQLAAAFKNETIVLLDDAALFDRALESVITNLRSMKSDP
nr:DUF1631 domain-containing protein [Pleionea sp. CnH1-48]